MKLKIQLYIFDGCLERLTQWKPFWQANSIDKNERIDFNSHISSTHMHSVHGKTYELVLSMENCRACGFALFEPKEFHPLYGIVMTVRKVEFLRTFFDCIEAIITNIDTNVLYDCQKLQRVHTIFTCKLKSVAAFILCC